MRTPDEVWMTAPCTPRACQLAALPIALDAVFTNKKGIIYKATGSGKSKTQAATLSALTPTDGWIDVVIVPTMALVEQMAEELRAWGLTVGRFYGPVKEVRAVTVVCLPSVEGLAESVRGRLQVRLALIDEAHRLGAEKTVAALALLAPRRILGWTATPMRTTGRSVLKELWPAGILYGYSLSDAIGDGAIVPPKVVPWEDEGNLDPDAATYELLRRESVGPMIVSAISVEDAEYYAKYLTDRGHPAEFIDGSMSKNERDRRIANLRIGRYRALTQVKLLTEGVDLPWLEGIALRVKIGSIIQYVQLMGRGLRTFPGKTFGLILDPLDMWGKFGLPRFSADQWEIAITAVDDAQEKEASGGGGGERVLDPAVAVVDLERWIAKVRAALLVGSEIETSLIRGNGWRKEKATEKQLARIKKWNEDRRKSPGRFLPKDVRERFGRLLEWHEHLSKGGAADVLDIGFGLQKRSFAYREKTGGWWPGIRELPGV